MSKQGESTDIVTVTLSPTECRSLHRLGKCFLGEVAAAQDLLNKLNEAEALSLWLRDQVRVELTGDELLQLDELRERLARPFAPRLLESNYDSLAIQTV